MANKDGGLRWTAYRADMAAGCILPGLQTYLVWHIVDKDATAEADAGGTDQLLETSLSIPDLQPGASADDFFRQVVEHSEEVEFKRVVSEKTTKAQSLRINSLIFPRSADPQPLRRSLRAYNYLQRCDEDAAALAVQSDWTSRILLNDLPGLGNVVLSRDSPPEFALKAFNMMKKPMQDAFRVMDDILAGISIIPGVAGCGKTDMTEHMAVFAQYGHESGKDLGFLYLMDLNTAVKNADMRFVDIYKRYSLADPPEVLRLYPMMAEAEGLVSAKVTEYWPSSVRMAESNFIVSASVKGISERRGSYSSFPWTFHHRHDYFVFRA